MPPGPSGQEGSERKVAEGVLGLEAEGRLEDSHLAARVFVINCVFYTHNELLRSDFLRQLFKKKKKVVVGFFAFFSVGG